MSNSSLENTCPRPPLDVGTAGAGQELWAKAVPLPPGAYTPSRKS